ncbi:MAG: tam [Betaproteobacteria bacterium]|nr:tam [Betaproteobacteria bacterium]
MTWDPTLYLKFGSDRLRPALDLLARVGLQAPKVVVDLGCGAGNVTQALRARWPDARQTHIIGVDSSPEMLARAAKTEPSAEWVQADISTWTPEAPVDLIFSNAALHWLPDHEHLFPRLMGFVKPGGELAVQMPNQTSAPSHAGIAESIDAAPLRGAVKAELMEKRLAPIAAPGTYYDWLSPAAQRVDQWETLYTHVLDGASPGSSAVAEWTQSTALKPILNAMDAPAQAWFWSDYCRRMNAAYPRRADGTTLFPFRRLFMVALKK